ncbi:hypothetical protein LKO27_01200 [Tessaracoccus sp. OS52]|uniref:hypothetical protein n=1 Tax=Tessaracoccus sp. OS52 TaxID=2886691 RepID=UPI001D113EDE|nr:hypothetical protein [Tessaracoccus sp. OS52]MCC2592047.1 hypothetical protein [Tessaracoccus sp. OS52]
MSESVELGRALTGEELPLEGDDVAQLVAQLAALGWDRARLADARRRRMETHQPWPFPVQVEVVRELGFARFQSRLVALREALGLTGRVDVGTPARRDPDRDEQRLLADRPPHWG